LFDRAATVFCARYYPTATLARNEGPSRCVTVIRGDLHYEVATLIDPNELRRHASVLNLEAAVIEQDYVLDWVLAGIGQTDEPKSRWKLEGPTALRKCFVESYRLSGSANFSVVNRREIDADALLSRFGRIAKWLEKTCGIVIREREIDIDNAPADGCVNLRIPYQTSLSRLVDGPSIGLNFRPQPSFTSRQRIRAIRPRFSDWGTKEFKISCWPHEQLFADAIISLCDQPSPETLFDAVSLFRNSETVYTRRNVLRLIQLRYRATGRMLPDIRALDAAVERILPTWVEALERRLPTVPPIETVLRALPPLFRWVHGAAMGAPLFSLPSRIEADSRLHAHTKGVCIDHPYFDAICYAASVLLCIEIEYLEGNGSTLHSWVEPYAAREKNGRHLLYGVDVERGLVRTYEINRIQHVHITERYYRPRYLVDIAFMTPRKLRPPRSTGRVQIGVRPRLD